MATSTLVAVLARLPMTATGVTLTLHVVGTLGHGYGAAGLVGTATTAGTALAAPLLGRMIDRYGLRPVVAVCGTTSATFWISAPHLPYAVLLVAALPAGALLIPAGPIARQVIAALVPAGQRRTAYSLDSVLVELTFMTGPALGILVTTQVSSTAALTAIGVLFGTCGCALYAVNPPVRTPDEAGRSRAAVRPPLTSWLGRHLVATLLVATGALFVLVGAELAALAALRESGEVGAAGVVIAVMCLASLVGGIVHGVARRSASQLTLMVTLAALTIPAALATQPWWLLALVLVPSNLVCAPTLAATTERVSQLAPPAVRGEAMGVQDSATRIGLALGSPVVGFVMDHTSPGMGFVAAGAGGLAFAAAGAALSRRGTADRTAPQPA
ncbi:putative arabinose efflux permease, MFS family [Prauserella flava]|uniref:MFS family permease n=2 Tax=Prauserella salsuginis group TaxID=2893672 RepID=A0A839XGY5_9PSEU|nr:MFS family permease [Prauserella sediminis]MCR3720941.1 putative arabinose efflux permease, MFS family [Prauserella flava]MCR3734978.1 putative arabinose efflux permease, MFS family [Prauserella salsuginis]